MPANTSVALAALTITALLGGLLVADIAQQRSTHPAASRCQPSEHGQAVDPNTGVIFDAIGNRFFSDNAAQTAWYGDDFSAPRTYCIASTSATASGLSRVWLEGADEWGHPRRVTPDVNGLDYCGREVCAVQVI